MALIPFRSSSEMAPISFTFAAPGLMDVRSFELDARTA